MAIPSGSGASAAQPIVVTVQPDHLPPRVQIQAQIAGATVITVYRSDPDGRVRVVRSANPAPATGGTIVCYDFESPTGRPVSYQAVSQSGSSVTAPPVTLTVDQPWLRHPAVPDLSLSPQVQSIDGMSRPSKEVVNVVMGRSTPVIVPDGGRKELQASLNLWTFSESDRTRLLALSNSLCPLLFDSPPAWGWDIIHAYLYLGSVPIENLAATGTAQTRLWKFPIWVVDMPAGPQQAQRTYDDLNGEAGSYTALNAMYGSYLDMLSGTR